MLSYTGRRNLFGNLVNSSDATVLTLGDTLMNAAEKRILVKRAWPFLNKKDTSLVTVASQQFYEIPQRIGKVKTFTITVSSLTYTPREIIDENEWNRLNEITVTSNTVEAFFVRGGQVGFYPVPASSSNTITSYGRAIPKDLTIADYTTGTITTLAAAGTAVTGSGTTWTAPMVGRYLRITESDTANTGDGYWYEIASRSSSTAIVLTKPYAGTAISTGSAAYTIGQMSLLPEGYHELPVYDAVRTYFASVQPDQGKFNLYNVMFKEMMAGLLVDYASQSSSVVLDDGNDYGINNPNLFVTL